MLSVIIISFNNSVKLTKCVNSILQNADELTAFEIIIIDNNSTEFHKKNIKEFINKNNSAKIILFENEKNDGFAKANNFAMKKARYENILLLNQDMVLLDCDLYRWLKIVDGKQENKKTGNASLTPPLGGRGAENEKDITSCKYEVVTGGKTYNLKGTFSETRFNFHPFRNLFSNNFDYLSGCCWLLKKKIYEQLNGFDEDFFMYGEDADFAFRAKKCGIKFIFLKEFTMIHENVNDTHNHFKKNRFLILQTMGKSLFLKKNYSKMKYIFFILVSIIHQLVNICVFRNKIKNRALFKITTRLFLKT